MMKFFFQVHSILKELVHKAVNETAVGLGVLRFVLFFISRNTCLVMRYLFI